MSIDLSPIEADVLRAIKFGHDTPSDIYDHLRPFYNDLSSIVSATNFLRRQGLLDRKWITTPGGRKRYSINSAGEDALLRASQMRIDGMPDPLRAARAALTGRRR